MTSRADLEAQKRWYAEELRWSGELKCERLIEALAKVPRERFMGQGPWQIKGEMQLGGRYARTPDADPRHLYHNVLVAIDARRGLNNGLPAFLARLIQLLSLREGESVCHVGCGTGYYSAVMAELVGPSGNVVAVELDERLCCRSAVNLSNYAQVRVVNDDGFSFDCGRVDALLVNAGVNHLSPIWLRNLRTKGRMVIPLTLEKWGGHILRAVRTGRNWQARLVSGVGIFPCGGGRDAQSELKLEAALRQGRMQEVRSLRLESHRRSRECWLHETRYCLSTRPWQAR